MGLKLLSISWKVDHFLSDELPLYLHCSDGVFRQDVLVVKTDGDVAEVLLLRQVAQVVLESR